MEIIQKKFFSLCAQQKNYYLELEHFLAAGDLVENGLLDILCEVFGKLGNSTGNLFCQQQENC